MEDKVLKNVQPPKDNEVHVSLHLSLSLSLSRGSAYYHLTNIFTKNQSACLQVSNTLSREEIALFAAKIKGLGVI